MTHIDCTCVSFGQKLGGQKKKAIDDCEHCDMKSEQKDRIWKWTVCAFIILRNLRIPSPHKVYHTTSGSLYKFDELHLIDESCTGSIYSNFDINISIFSI